MTYELDRRFTFDSFVVGSANQLAAAAARKVAEAPGATYNPLYIYSGSGLGKTHLLTAIGHEVLRLHGGDVVFETVEQMLSDIGRALEAGKPDALRARLEQGRVVLLDDVQFLAGRRQVQDELIHVWDAHVARGGQVVLTSDRPPQDIDALDERLLGRLSGGLIVDMGSPDYETRVVIARRKAEERGQTLSPEVIQVVARIAFTNVRELQGALNRLLAVQELDGRVVEPDEVWRLLGVAAERGVDEFGVFLSDISESVSAAVEAARERIADAILAWEGEGYRTRRLERALDGTVDAAQAAELVARFEGDVARLRDIEAAIRELDGDAPEAQAAALRDPDRLVEARALLAAVRERLAPPPGPPAGGGLDTLAGDSLALRAARAVAARPGGAYNPLYVLAPDPAHGIRLLEALGNELVGTGEIMVAYSSGRRFEEELIDAIAAGRVEAWRSRYRRAHALVLEGLDSFAEGEGAHGELFHLFEDLYRRGGQIVCSASVAPQQLPLPDRLRTRLESGLVVELEMGELHAPAGDVADGDAMSGPDSSSPDSSSAASPVLEAAGPVWRTPAWFRDGGKVLREWPYPEDVLEEALD